jgi:hypothetical protein
VKVDGVAMVLPTAVLAANPTVMLLQSAVSGQQQRELPAH